MLECSQSLFCPKKIEMGVIGRLMGFHLQSTKSKELNNA